MKPEGSITQAPPYDVTESALQSALSLLLDHQVCTLKVSSGEFLTTKALLRRITADLVDNPLAPQINLVIDESYKDYEWSLEVNGKIYWSPGA